MLLQCLGWHPFQPRRPPLKGWVVALDWPGVSQVIWPAMKPWVPKGLVQVHWQRKTGVELPNALIFTNGSELHFKSAEAGREKLQGADLDFAWLDEEQDKAIVEEVRARLLDRGGNLSLTLTPVARKAWVRDLEREQFNGKPLTRVIRASMRDAAEAGLLSADHVEQFLASLPERQRRIRELGEFGSFEGLVYPEFDRQVHILRPRGNVLADPAGKAVYPWPLPKEWRRFAAIDFGYVNPTAVIVAAEDPGNGRIVVERCLYAASIRASRWATILRDELPPLAAPLIADHQAFERAELSSAGVPTIPARKDVIPGLEATERRFHPRDDGRPGIYLVLDDVAPPTLSGVGRTDCHWIAWELDGYRYPERKDGQRTDARDLPVKKDDHAADGLRYLCMFLEHRTTGDAPIVPAGPEKDSPLKDAIPPVPWR